MITVKNISNQDCIESLEHYLKTESRKITIHLIGENDYGNVDIDPVEMKKSFPSIIPELILDFHGIIQYIQQSLDDFWFWNNCETSSVFKFYVLMEYLQMIRYRNPGFNPDHQTVIVYHLKDETTHDIHCQIVGSSPFHPSHPDFFKFFKSSVNTFFQYH